MRCSLRSVLLLSTAWLFACTHNLETGKPTVAPVGVGAMTDADDVEGMVKEKLSDLNGCYKEERLSNPKAFGKVLLSFDVRGDGRTSEVRLLASTLKSPNMEGCLVGRVEAWQFAPPKDGKTIKIRYPFSFQP